MQHLGRYKAMLVRALIATLGLVIFFALEAHPASAGIISGAACGASGATGGTGLPWEGPLCKVVSSLTGVVAMAISIGAIFAAGAALVFGEEMSGFVKRLLAIVVAVAFLIGGGAIVNTLFSATLG